MALWSPVCVWSPQYGSGIPRRDLGVPVWSKGSQYGLEVHGMSLETPALVKVTSMSMGWGSPEYFKASQDRSGVPKMGATGEQR